MSDSSRHPVLNSYVDAEPTDQNAVDLFTGQWTSAFMDEFSHIRAGRLPLFHDGCLIWAIERAGGVEGKKILENGPLEGAHSWLLEHLGAASILSIEMNASAYLRCLITKEITGLRRVKYLLGNSLLYLHGNPDRFDLCLASGILYHMRQPAELIERISRVTDQVYIWTHYYDAAVLNANPFLQRHFTRKKMMEYDGFHYPGYVHEYCDALDQKGFCGGSENYSVWMEKADILRCLNNYGFNEIDTNCDQPHHQHGPAFAIFARRNRVDSDVR